MGTLKIKYGYIENKGTNNQSINNQNTNNKTNIDKSILVNNVEINDFLDKSEKTIKAIKKEELLKENIKCIIDYLNQSIKAKYKYTTKGTISCIKARFKDGFVLDDFYNVIDKKVNEWLNTDMEKYLRPETLFGNKFENYLNQKTYFKGTPKTSYSSKPSFDNTASHEIQQKISLEEYNNMTFEQKKDYLIKLPVADMTKGQKEFFNENCLARDENGNLIKF